LPLVRTFEFGSGASTYSSDGKWLAVDAGETVDIRDAMTGNLETQFSVPWASLTGASQVLFSPDGTLLVHTGVEEKITIWDFHTKKLLHIIENPLFDIETIAFSPDGTILVTVFLGGASGTVYFWDTTTWHKVSQLDVTTLDIAYSPNGKWIATSNITQLETEKVVVELWDAHTYQLAAQLFLAEPESSFSDVRVIAFSPDGKLLGAIVDQRLHLWDVETQKEVTSATVKNPENVWHMTFSSQGMLAMISLEGVIVLYDIKTDSVVGKTQIEIKESYPFYPFLQFSPDGTNLLVGNTGYPIPMQIWRVSLHDPERQ
jgi:WD40 repeat protein